MLETKLKVEDRVMEGNREERESSGRVALTLYTYHRIAQLFHSAVLLGILNHRRFVFSSSISSWRMNPREPS